MKHNKILTELLIGNILCGIVVQFICTLVAKDFLFYTVGLWCGVGLSCFLCIHIRMTLEEAIELPIEDAVKSLQQSYVRRTMIIMGTAGLVLICKIGSPVTLIIGISILKVLVYLKLYMHKLSLWFRHSTNGEKSKGEDR